MAQNGWHRVDPADVPDDGRVRSVVVDGRTVALSRCGATLGALENRCPHQGGPLGEGSIEKVLGRGAFQDVDLSAVFKDVSVSTTTIHSGSDHAELAALAVKHAVDGRGVAWRISCCPTIGKISKEQLAEDYPVWHTSLHNPDWAGYARLCGATGIRVTSRDQLDEAMRALFAAAGPALLCVEQDAELL